MSRNEDSTLQRPLEINPDVLFKRVDEELVLVKIASNEIFALNETGARLWELISEGAGVEAATSRLSEEYGEPERGLRVQVEVFVAELRSEGFLLP